MLRDGDLRLRTYDSPRDVDAALAWYTDPDVLRFSEGPDVLPFDRDRVERMYLRLGEIGELYMIEVLRHGTWHTVGDVTLARHTLPIVIGEVAERGRGIGGRVLRLLIGRARALGWGSLTARRIYAYNGASRRLFLGAGFTLAERGADESGHDVETYRLML